jgi:hypothetical protein
MALGKTVSYTPFNETSFGYGSNEIATAHATEFPNADDIVKVTIEHLSGNWDSTGHLATPSIGTAVATYHKLQEYWTVKGERDDVDAVLAAMSFFPADKAETRTWTPTALKDNQTSGTYADEEPPTIGDTSFSLKVYDGATVVSGQTVTFSVTEAVFGNQRPYWAVAPTNEDLNSSAHDAVAGGLVDFGTISHGSDTENVRVTCEFRRYGDSEYTTTGSYGAITQDENIYIGNKKQAETNNTDARFDFTGSVAEAQAFLDSVRYYGASNQNTFDMFLTITDGVVGSTLTKTCYFSDSLITATTIPDQSFIEDGDAWQDFGIVSFGNIQPDVTQFSCTVTFDATGHSGISHGYFGTGTYVDGQPLTTTRSTLAELQADLRLLELYMVQDFNSDFTYTVDFTFSNPTLGTSYTATQQTINVSGVPQEEIANPTTTHSWTEDQRYDFVDSKTPQIIHPRNEQFDVIFTLSDANAGVLGRHGGSGFFTNSYGTSAQYKLQGTRDQVNIALQNLFFTPNADYDDSFTITFTVDRTSGDLTHATQQTGSFTMNAVALADFSFPLTNPEINWENNVSLDFNSGLQIADTADESEFTPTFESTYTVVARLKIDGSAFTHGVLSCDVINLLDNVTGDYTNELTFTGLKEVVNGALSSLIFIPDPLYDELHDFYVEYQVTRDADNAVLEGLDFSPSVRTDFKNPTITAPYYVNAQLFDWTEDTPLEFDTLFRITETVSENTDYTTANGYDDWYNSQYKVTIHGKYWDGSTSQELTDINFSTTTAPNANLLVSGSGTVSDPLVLQGSKAELNKAFATMKMIPTTLDFTNSPATNGSFWFEHKLERMRDNSIIINYNEQLGSFNAGTDTPEYKFPTGDFFPHYTEDKQAQYIFSDLITGDVITDAAGDYFDATYDVTFTLQNETTGKFVPYVDEGYLEDDELNIFVNDYEIRIVGSKLDVNEAIKNIQFSPYADVNTNVDIHYTQKRTYNNTTVTHANNQFAVTLIGDPVPEYVMGSTAIGNMQFFVQDEHLIGLDLTNGDFVIDDLETDDFVILTPSHLSSNSGYGYDAPITIVDEYEDGGASLYKVVFDGGNLFTAKNEDLTTLGASLNITDTGWQPKETLNSILENGIYVTGVSEANANIPLHGSRYDVTFTVYRKTAAGTETQLTGERSLRYFFLSGLTAWKKTTSSGNPANHHTLRFDNNTTTDVEIDAHQFDNSFEFRDSRGNQRFSSLAYTFLPLNYQYVYIDPRVDDTSDYFVTDTDSRPYGMTLTNDQGNTINVDYKTYLRNIYNYDNIGVLRRQVKFYGYTTWGAYIQLGSDTTDTGDWRLFFRQN